MAIDYSAFAIPKPASPPKDRTRIHDDRTVLSKKEYSKLKERIWIRDKGICQLCFKPITDKRDYELDHRNPRGLGGGKRNDMESNVQASHGRCNRKKGSKRQ